MSKDSVKLYNVGEQRLAKDVLAANFAYLKDPITDEIDARVLDGKGLILSDLMDDTNHAEFRAAIIIDKETKQITYAVAGTRVDQGSKRAIADLRDDARLAAGYVPRKIEAAQNLNEMIITELGDNLQDYTFNFTGHSLGAVMADCAAADMIMRMKNKGIDIREGQISTVTFDNPGAHTAVEGVCKSFAKAHPTSPKMDIEDIKARCSFKAINNRDNFINTMDKQVGEKFTIVPEGQKPLNTFNKMCGWIAKKTNSIPIVRSIAGFLSHGRLTSQVQDHSLENFKNVIVEHQGHLRSKTGKEVSFDEAMTGLEPIKCDTAIFHKLKNEIAENKKPITKADKTFSMTNDEGERIEFSQNQLVKAHTEISPHKQPNALSHASLVVQNVSSEKQASTRKFTDMFKTKKFHIKTADEVVSQIKNRGSSVSR